MKKIGLPILINYNPQKEKFLYLESGRKKYKREFNFKNLLDMYVCSLWHRFDSKLFRAIQQINLKMDETVAYYKNKPESGLYRPVKGPV